MFVSVKVLLKIFISLILLALHPEFGHLQHTDQENRSKAPSEDTGSPFLPRLALATPNDYELELLPYALLPDS